jgi:hypothetical protein
MVTAGGKCDVLGSGFWVQRSESRVQGTVFKEGLQSYNPRMKLTGTIPNREVIFRETIPGIEVFRNLKSEAPNSKEIPNVNVQ